MKSIFRGERVSHEEFISRLETFHNIVNEDLLHTSITVDEVINAIDKLRSTINIDDLISKLNHLGIPDWTIKEYISLTTKNITKEELQFKMEKELGPNPFSFREVKPGIYEKYDPLGVLLHIGAGNTLGLAAFSVLEGLLTKNINILKLPEMEGGISTDILMKLIEIEPKLKPFIYVINISSKNSEIIEKLLRITDGVIVWGSDLAVDSLRKMTPPYIKLIEWGHRISFSYFEEINDQDIHGLAKDIILTDQLYCSSPQVVFLETKNKQQIDEFATKLYQEMNILNKKHPSTNKPINVLSEITWIHELITVEELLGEKKLLANQDKDFSVMIDYTPSLKPSPLFRNIWVMPIDREHLFSIIRAEKGHLQTCGLSSKGSFDELSNILYKAGVTRVVRTGTMSSNYSGEPHDGVVSLSRYVKRVNKN